MSDLLREFVNERLTKMGHSLRRFARNVGMSSSAVSKVLRWENGLSLDDTLKWSEGLDLKGAERDDFLRLVLLGHCPPEIRDHIVKGEPIRWPPRRRRGGFQAKRRLRKIT